MKIETLHKRDKGICHICGNYVPIENSTRDHIITKADGGADSSFNLKLAHDSCNQNRGRKPMLVSPAPLELVLAISKASKWIKIANSQVLADIIWLEYKEDDPDGTIEKLFVNPRREMIEDVNL